MPHADAGSDAGRISLGRDLDSRGGCRLPWACYWARLWRRRAGRAGSPDHRISPAPGGNPVVWYTTHPLYFTDPGDLSAYVNNAAANALVAAAAGVWNVPTAAMAVAYGGALAEHVSGANAYLGSNGPVFPADVQSSNYAAMQIAVIYDSDGSVTDMLLGGGASSPAECRQNAVTESVDSIVPAGFIQHAILVLNGRCTGPAPRAAVADAVPVAAGLRAGAWAGTGRRPTTTSSPAIRSRPPTRRCTGRSCIPSTLSAACTPTSACRSRSPCATTMSRRSRGSIR